MRRLLNYIILLISIAVVVFRIGRRSFLTQHSGSIFFWFMAPLAPSPRQFCEIRMPICRDVFEKHGTRENIRDNIFKCPKGELCISNVPDGSSLDGEYTNPYPHLLKCFADSSREFLLHKYHERRADTESMKTACINEPTTCGHTLNPNEKCMHDYIRFIIEKNASLSVVSLRNVSKYAYKYRASQCEK